MKKLFTTTALSVLILFTSMTMKAQIVDRDLTNLVIFMRFADDTEITHDFPSIDSMFNGKTPGYLSIANFYDALTYGHIRYNTLYTNNIQNRAVQPLESDWIYWRESIYWDQPSGGRAVGTCLTICR